MSVVVNNKKYEIYSNTQDVKNNFQKNSKFSSIEGNPHLTVSGDTLQNIAKKYNITIDQLKQWNGAYSQYDANTNLPVGIYLIVNQVDFLNAGKYTVVVTNNTASNKTATVIDPSSIREQNLTPELAAEKIKAIGNDLKIYLSSLSEADQIKFWESYGFIADPGRFPVAVRETTFIANQHPYMTNNESDNGQFVPTSAIEKKAEEFNNRFVQIQNGISDAQLTARINGFTTLVGGVGSLALAVLSAESVAGAIYFGTVGLENIGSGTMQMWQGWNWQGDTPLSMTLELAGVSKKNAQTTAFVVGTLPAGAGAYYSTIKAINATSKVIKVASTIVAVDQTLTASTGVYSAVTGEIHMSPQQKLLRSMIGERGAAIFNLTTTGVGQYNAISSKIGKAKGNDEPDANNKIEGDDVDANGRVRPIGSSRYGVYLQAQEAEAIKNPKLNFAESPQLIEMQKWVKGHYGDDHELIVGYGTDDLTGVWGNFQAMRGAGWVTDPKYIALDARPTLRYGIAKIQTTAEGTFLDPIVIARSAQVSGTPKILVPTETSSGLGLQLVTSNDPNILKTVGINRQIFAERLGVNGVTDLNSFLSALGTNGEEPRFYEVGSVYVSPEQRGGGYGYGISYLTKLIQNKILEADYISSADPDNWSNSSTTTTQTYPNGAVHPNIVYAYPTNPDGTGGIPSLTMIASNNPKVESYLTNIGWLSLSNFKDMAKGDNGLGKRFNANFKLYGIEYQNLSEIPAMPEPRN